MKQHLKHLFLISMALVLGLALRSFADSFAIEKNLPPDFTLSVEAASATETTVRFSLNDVKTEHEVVGGTTFSRFTINGAQPVSVQDLPDLPIISKLLLVPSQCGIELIISNVSKTLVKGVIPFPASASESGENNLDPAVLDGLVDSYISTLDTASISPDGFYPTVLAEIQPPAIMRGYRIVKLIINPLRWNPQTRDLEVLHTADFKLNFNTALNQTNIISDPSRPRPARYMKQLLGSIGIDMQAASHEGIINGGSIAFVIGDWDDVAAALEPLVEWKRRMGWTAEIIRVSNNNWRIDILNALLDVYQNWEIPPEYVVLVGDAPGEGGNDYTLAYWNEQAGGQYAYETDHHYAELEGDDVLPEAAVGRLVFDSIGRLQDQVDKIIQYEAYPYNGDGVHTDWQLNAAVAATDNRSGSSSINLCNWFKDLALENGFNDVMNLYFTDNDPQPDPTDFLSNVMGRGISFLLYRGWADMNGFEPRDITRFRNGGMLPFVMLATCNTGEYALGNGNFGWSYSERFAIHDNGGAIGCVGTSGATHTAYNNMIASSTLRAPFVEGISSQGWALMRGKLALYANYAGRGDIQHHENRNMEAWLTHLYIYNLMGDPSVELFTDVPRELRVTHPDFLRPGETHFEIEIENAADNTPAAGVRACLYSPGVFQLVAEPDDEGICRFVLNGDWVDRESVKLTVTGTNVMPYLADLDIEEGEAFFGVSSINVDDDHYGLSSGDGDGLAMPHERIELSVEITNHNLNNPGEVLTATLTSASANVNIVSGEAIFNSVPEPDEFVSGQFLVEILDQIHTTADIEFELTVSSGENVWVSRLTLPTASPVLESAGIEWIGDPLAAGENASLLLSLHNRGKAISVESSGQIFSLHPLVNVLQSETGFGPVIPGDFGRCLDTLVLAADDRLPADTRVSLLLVLKNNNGFEDTVVVDFTLNSDGDDSPFCPDNYGYYCIDDTDQLCVNRPNFEWIEIDPNRDGQGTDTNLDDRREDDDQSVEINLPFNFIYYGREFVRLTICSNGWVALGNHGEVNSARNRRMLDGEVPPAMICPFWEDMITTNSGGIYYWYNRDEHYFVVEWSLLRKLGPQGINEPEETFQVILYDPEFHESRTGDGDILFQYLEVTDNRSCYQEWDTPFATVGMTSPELVDGLEYTYWGQLHEGAARLESERAVLITTRLPWESGVIQGTVTEADSNSPVSGVRITTETGFCSLTDEAGFFRMTGLPEADNYIITAAKSAYCDTTLPEIAVTANEEVEINVSLLKPEFRLSRDELWLEVLPDSTVNGTITLRNPGSGSMHYQSQLAFGWEDTLDTWYPLLTWAASDSVDDSALRGICFTGDKWIISGGSNGTDENWFYHFDRDGNYEDRVSQPLVSSNGIRDMEFYDGFLYGVYWSSYIKKTDPQSGEEISRLVIPAECTQLRGLTIDPATGNFYISCRNGVIYALEPAGEDTLVIIDQFYVIDPRDQQTASHCNSLSWFAEDRDGFNLYITSDYDPDGNDHRTKLSVYKVETATHQIKYLTDLPSLGESFTFDGGTCITSQWHSQMWVLAGIFDSPAGDVAGVFALSPDATWIDYEPSSGTLEASESSEISFTIDPAGLDFGVYHAAVDFRHNANSGVTRLPVELSVTNVLSAERVHQPESFKLLQNFPNPFNSVTRITFTLESAGLSHMAVYNLQGRLVAKPVNGFLEAGSHTITFDAENLASGLYMYRLDHAGDTSVRKAVLLK